MDLQAVTSSVALGEGFQIIPGSPDDVARVILDWGLVMDIF